MRHVRESAGTRLSMAARRLSRGELARSYGKSSKYVLAQIWVTPGITVVLVGVVEVGTWALGELLSRSSIRGAV